MPTGQAERVEQAIVANAGAGELEIGGRTQTKKQGKAQAKIGKRMEFPLVK
jgi:hypothetical protein